MNDEAMLRCNSGVSPTLDPDTIYYTKTSIAAIFDVSFAWPFYPFESIVKHIEGRFMRKESLPALSMFKGIIGCIGIITLEYLVAPLPGEDEMVIQIVRRKNPKVAAFLRGCSSHSPRPMCSIFSQTTHPDHVMLLAPGDGWPFEHIPMADSDVLGTCLSKQEANETARGIFRQWKADGKWGETLIAGINDGLFMDKFVFPTGCRCRSRWSTLMMAI
jgi:hypothetical protein